MVLCPEPDRDIWPLLGQPNSKADLKRWVLKLVGIVYVALTAVSMSYGFGRHMATLSANSIMQAQKYLIISFVPGILMFALPKFAVVILLAKIRTSSQSCSCPLELFQKYL